MLAIAAPARACSLTALFVLTLSTPCFAQVSFRMDNTEADTERLEQALTQRGSLNVLDTPLNEVVEKLSTQFEVPFELSAKKLEEAGINVDTPVTKRLDSLPLESILDILLDELELDFTIRSGVILVTTPEHLESPDMMEFRIYPVRDLVMRHIPSATKDSQSYAADYDSLIDVITTTIAPESWTDVGGPGSIREFDNSAAIIVSQTGRVHRDLERLLATLRRVKEFQGVTSLPLSSSAAAKSRSKHIAARPAATPRRRAAAAEASPWQLPQVHAGE
jgi:hypothetical protein